MRAQPSASAAAHIRMETSTPRGPASRNSCFRSPDSLRTAKKTARKTNAANCTSCLDYSAVTETAGEGRDGDHNERSAAAMAEDTTLFENVEGTLQWLNRPVTEKNWESVRRALRWSEFKFPKLNKKDHPLEFDAL